MTKRNVTLFQVNNGNCSLVCAGDLRIVFDLKGTEDQTSWDLLKGHFPLKEGKRILDILCISHNDGDHCGGFSEWKEKIDNDELVIGSIWHQDYDRTKVEDKDDLPEDYLALQKEIDRRKNSGKNIFGEIEVALKGGEDENIAFLGVPIPQDVKLKVLSPFIGDENESEWDTNELSLVINFEISGLKILYAGDSGSKAWQERIFPKIIKKQNTTNWAKSDLFIASHHGSFTFFGPTREEVRDSKDPPENYESLNYIDPDYLIVSANNQFPTSRDQSGDQPPHYAAWKWYHKWFRDNKGVNEENKHPPEFKYTSDGHLRLELGDDGRWQWKNDWSPDDGGDDGSGKGFIYRGGETNRGESEYA